MAARPARSAAQASGVCEADIVAADQKIVAEATADKIVTAALSEIKAKAGGLSNFKATSLEPCCSTGSMIK